MQTCTCKMADAQRMNRSVLTSGIVPVGQDTNTKGKFSFYNSETHFRKMKTVCLMTHGTTLFIRVWFLRELNSVALAEY